MSLFLDDGDVRLYHGDALTVLQTLEDASVHMCVTSPPFYGLRDYGTGRWEGGNPDCDHLGEPFRTKSQLNQNWGEGYADVKNAENRQPFKSTCGKCGARRVDQQIGLEETPEQWVASLVAVFREVRRVLRPEGTLWLEIGDSYASQRGSSYGMADTTPEDSQAHDSSSSRLCDACRAAPQTGRNPHTDNQPVPAPGDDSPDPNQGHTGSDRGRPPSSGSAHPTTTPRSSAATQDQPQTPTHADEQPPGAQVSTLLDASPVQPQTSCEACGDSLDAAPSSVHSSTPDAQASDRSSPAYTDGTAEPPATSDRHKTDKGLDASAYPHYRQGVLKSKDLIGAPWLLAFALRADGWWLRSDIIWSRPNPMPESVTDRPTKSHSFIFLLAKNPRYFFDQEAVREPAEYGYRPTRNGNIYDRVGDSGSSPEKTPGVVTHGGDPSTGRNVRSVWNIATQPYPEAHFATFPEELARRCILAGTSERGCCPECGAPWVRETAESVTGERHVSPKDWNPDRNDSPDTGSSRLHSQYFDYKRETTGWRLACTHDGHTPCVVLDPFVGSGTVPFVARKHGRHAIGIDLSESYLELAARRLQQLSLFA